MSSSPSTCDDIVEESLDVNNVDAIVIKEPIGRFVCEKCDVTFTAKNNLKRHSFSKHGSKFETENKEQLSKK